MRLVEYAGISVLFIFSLMNPYNCLAAERAGIAGEGPSPGNNPPTLLWEKTFDPLLKQTSDRNSNGDYLFVQWHENGQPWKLLVLDGKGNLKREELLPEKTKRLIPPEQAWLLTGGDSGNTGIAKVPVEADVWGADVKVSYSGDYYAVLSRGEGGWYNIAYKDKNGATLHTIVPRDNYGLFDYLISHDGNTIVVVDMKADWDEDDRKARGQRVYFYNARGLVKDYDYGTNPDAWLDAEKILISKNGRYVAATRGVGNNGSSLVLFDNSGRVLMEKRFFERHYLHDITNTGEILVSDYDLEKEALLVDKDGKVIGKKDPPIKSDILLSNDGRYLVNGWDLVNAQSGKTVFHIDPASLFHDMEIDAAGYADAPLEGKPLVFVFGYSACCRKYYSALVNFEDGKVLWRKDNAICTFTNNGKSIYCGNLQLYAFE